MKNLLLLSVLILLVLACNPSDHHFEQVEATIETESVNSSEDAADDMAIYVPAEDPSKSIIIGTDKQKSLELYDLTGKSIVTFPLGRINNVDIRQEVAFDSISLTIVGGSNRTDNSLTILAFYPDSLQLVPILDSPIISAVNEVYGFCFYKSPINGFLYAFVVGKDGIVEQWLLTLVANKQLHGRLTRSFDVGEQCEGMVADDQLSALFIGEEEFGIWKYPAEPDQPPKKERIDEIKHNPDLIADIEGLTIYYGPENEGYLIASIQGNNSFAIYNRKFPHRYIGSFRIGPNEELGIDEVSGTDGIDITHLPMGNNFPFGAFIAQDDSNRTSEGTGNQNFKLVPWERIAKAFRPDLIITAAPSAE